MPYDHYQETKALISMLDDAGLKHDGVLLQKALDEGATSTEILMALRWHIGQLLKKMALDKTIKAKAKRLLTELDRVLQ